MSCLGRWFTRRIGLVRDLSKSIPVARFWRAGSAAALIGAATTMFTAQAESTPWKGISMSTSESLSGYFASTHVERSRRNVVVDGESVELVRYERMDKRNAGLGGEHFSTVVDGAGKLKGFSNMSLDMVGKPLPKRERAQSIAMKFLGEFAPDLLLKMQISWIEPHDEPLSITRDGRTTEASLTGMKVKARNLIDGRWFWVIVGPDERPMVFERDIVWITFPGHRRTEKWLHDSWLAQKGGEGALLAEPLR